MNTRLFYSFTDKDDWTRYASVVIKGEMRWKELKKLLDQKMWFLPPQVGLPDISNNMPGELEHTWHNIGHDGIELTDENPDIDLDTRTLVQRFRDINRHWRLDKIIPVKYLSQS
jgi:hypothetical protein